MRNYLFDRDPALAAPYPWAPPEDDRKRRRRKLRGALAAAAFLVLIAALAVTAVLLRRLEGSLEEHLENAANGYEDNDPYFGLYPGLFEGGESQRTDIPRAEAGVGPLLSVSAHTGDALSGEEIYEKVLPSIVSITAYADDFASAGSGVVLSADGYIITNYHVIEGTRRSTVTLLSTGATGPARLVGYYADMDLAVLKIEADGLVPAEFGSSRDLRPGEQVYAVGNPMGYLYGSITTGIVSAVGRSITVGGYSMTLIQTDAPLNSGNSGGALVNQWGQVVGITVAKIDPHSDVTAEGLGLAIPISEGRRCVNTLLRVGEMEDPAIGIYCQDVPEDGGVLVVEVNLGGAAQEAGLLPGDVILAANGEEIAGVDELKDMIYDLGVGAEMRCTVQRMEERLELTMILQAA